MEILVQGENTRIVRNPDGSLSPQEKEHGFWFTCYYPDGFPVKVGDNEVGLAECESRSGLKIPSNQQ